MFFVNENQIEENKITIYGEDVNHIINVLRLPLGEKILICNGQGKEYCCIIDFINKDKVICNVISSYKSKQELPTKIYLFQGLPKQDKMELIIQKSVELGIFEIIPVIMSRSVVKISNKNFNKKNDRYQKISLAAAKQSHRGIIPNVKEIMTFEEALLYAEKLEKLIIPYEKADNMNVSKEIFANSGKYSSIGIFIGPEGGFEEIEIDKLLAIGSSIVSLGRRILRTETASLAALSILMYNLEED